MMAHEALEIIHRIIEPKRLNYAQELVFLQSWSGKIYKEIASEYGYDLDYIKEVGSQLWNLLSIVTEKKVTKKNFKLVLSALYKNQIDRLAEPSERFSPRLEPLKFPSGAVPIHSNLYIDRPPMEERVYAEVTRPGSLICIKAPKQMGKTSLIYRALAYAGQKQFDTVILNLQKADSSFFNDLNQFLRWFCLNVSRQLHLEPKLDQYWDEAIGSKVSCSIYFQEYLLSSLNSSIVLALDEVNRIFAYPNLAKDFLPLLRTWHEEAANSEIWQKLRLILAHSTEAYLQLNINQSLLNMGLPVQLPGFTLAQTQDLVQRYGLSKAELDDKGLASLLRLTGGHPYLIRLALYWLRQRELTLSRLLQEAPSLSGIYGSHLRQYAELLQQHSELQATLQQLVNTPDGIQLEATIAYRLESLGLVKLQGSQAMLSCELYRLYFGGKG